MGTIRKTTFQEEVLVSRTYNCSRDTINMPAIFGSRFRNIMNYPAASYGVSKTARNEASFGEYNP
jgi:hypothetical protein